MAIACTRPGFCPPRGVASARPPFGPTIKPDMRVDTPHPLSVWPNAARVVGAMMLAADRQGWRRASVASEADQVGGDHG